MHEGHVAGVILSVSSSFVVGGVSSASSAASGMVGQYLSRTCLSAGRRMGLGRKKFMPEAMHSLTLFSSENAVSATIGAEKPNSRMSRVL